MMKKFILVIGVSLGLLSIASPQPMLKCGAYHESPASPNRQKVDQAVIDWLRENLFEQISFRTVVTIPVVVHVVWSKQEENISDAQILSQFEILNKDFRKLNVEIPGIPAVFQSLVADVELEFCLATKDPSGNATNGITRTFTNNSVGIGGTSTIHYTSQGGRDAWDTEHYLNIWVAKFAGNVGGIAAFPGEGPPAEDGIEINYKQFGTLNTEAPYNLGRTCTHEIGHYFNLEHIWGPDILDCCEDDFVADTPPACETYLNQCPVHPVVSCAGPDMFMNYMFYSDDACMGIFTNGQKMRMLATLNTVRSGLLDSSGCMAVSTTNVENKLDVVVYQNPVKGNLNFELINGGVGEWVMGVYDLTGRVRFTHPFFAQKQSVTVETLPAGVYFLIVENGQHHFTKKIIKE